MFFESLNGEMKKNASKVFCTYVVGHVHCRVLDHERFD
jgi:hypothetical protein